MVYTHIFLKIEFRELIYKCNRHNKHFKLVPLAYSFDGNHLGPQINNFLSGEDSKVHTKKKNFLWPCTICPAWSAMREGLNMNSLDDILTYFRRYLLAEKKKV